MALKVRYFADKFTLYKGDEIKTDLSLAIQLIDEVTDKGPLGQLKLKVKDEKKKIVKNPSDYYIFTGLKEREYTIVIESDLYLLKEITIDASKVISLHDIKLDFNATGPVAGAKWTSLKDVSKLIEGYIVELNNNGDTEERGITKIEGNKIFWRKPLKHNFNAPGSKILALDFLFEIILRPMPAYPFPDHTTLVRGLIFDSNNEPVDDAIVEMEGYDIKTMSDEGGEFVLYFKEVKTEQIKIAIEKNGVRKPVPGEKTLAEGETIFVKKITFP